MMGWAGVGIEGGRGGGDATAPTDRSPVTGTRLLGLSASTRGRASVPSRRKVKDVGKYNIPDGSGEGKQGLKIKEVSFSPFLSFESAASPLSCCGAGARSPRFRTTGTCDKRSIARPTAQMATSGKPVCGSSGCICPTPPTTPVIINHRNSPQHYPYGTAWWEAEDDTGHIETGILYTYVTLRCIFI